MTGTSLARTVGRAPVCRPRYTRLVHHVVLPPAPSSSRWWNESEAFAGQVAPTALEQEPVEVGVGAREGTYWLAQCLRIVLRCNVRSRSRLVPAASGASAETSPTTRARGARATASSSLTSGRSSSCTWCRPPWRSRWGEDPVHTPASGAIPARELVLSLPGTWTRIGSVWLASSPGGSVP